MEGTPTLTTPDHVGDPTGPPTVPPPRPRLVQPVSGRPRDPTDPTQGHHPGRDTGTRRPTGRRSGPAQATPRPDSEPDTRADRKDTTTNTRPDSDTDSRPDTVTAPTDTGPDNPPDTPPDNPDAPPDNPPDTPPEEGADTKGQNSQASRLVALAIGRYNLVNGGDGRCYAVDRDGPNVALPLRGRDSLRQRLARVYYRQTGVTPGGSALSDALQVIEGMAADSPVVPVGLRVARHDGAIVLDLGMPPDGRWSSVPGGGGWWTCPRCCSGAPR